MWWRRRRHPPGGVAVPRNPEALEAQERAASARRDAEAGIPEAQRLGAEFRRFQEQNHFSEAVAEALRVHRR